MSLRTEPTRLVALRLRVHGQVQGRGVRPAIARRAAELGLAGSVRNTRNGLEIIAESGDAALRRFCDELSATLPQGCHIDAVDEEPIDALNRSGFEILHEDLNSSLAAAPLATPVPPDISVCRHCLNEVADRSDRRHGYPLTSCAACGPRYTVIRSMPYERAETAMAGFPLCVSCGREYTDPHDRRFHAQTTACRECGPTIWAVDAAGLSAGRDAAALNAVTASLRDGRIIALRGIGGYQLLCDAENDSAVQRLRSRNGGLRNPCGTCSLDC
jgi:hydrogenase maturation protein HypF